MKTVAIIGAGPSGLVAAKTLLRSKSCQYKVQIFEKTSEIGGLWAVHKDRPYDGMLNPQMPTNLSRFNIGFSDLAWSSVGLDGHVPYWPKAWQVGQYLRAYSDRYIPKDVFSFNTKVTYTTFEKEINGRTTWKLRWESEEGNLPSKQQEGSFDHVIIATGLFGASTLPGLGDVEDIGLKVAHSTKLRQLKDVLPDDPDAEGILLVVGGGMSGADVSTVLAMQLSDALYSPNSDGKRYSKVKLVQLCPEPAYALPLAAPTESPTSAAPTFLPLDLAMYDLGKRPPGNIELGAGKMPSEVIQAVHDAFQNIVGDQSELGVPSLTYKDAVKAAYVTLTEQYSGFIRSGQIEIRTGRLNQVTIADGSKEVQAHFKHKGKKDTVDNVIGIVLATGFSPQPSLDFLAPEVRQALSHDANHNRLPILLDEHATLGRQTPGLAVVGFHEGAFWGSMEMEARLVEKRWSSAIINNNNNIDTDNKNDKHHSQIPMLRELRIAMTEKSDQVPQYWLGDYVGLMETLARECSIQRNDLTWSPRTGPISGARYTDPSTDDVSESHKTLDEFVSVLNRSLTSGLFAPRAAFLALHGSWQISRTITSFLPDSIMPSGRFEGTCHFHPRHVTDPTYDFEYLYTERGNFSLSSSFPSSGFTGNNNLPPMTAVRQYVYRYQESTDQISVWFVKPITSSSTMTKTSRDGNNTVVDYLYHDLIFKEKAIKGWKAKASHLCVKDMYDTDYLFRFKGAGLNGFDVVHKVKGPRKDYVSESFYSRRR